MQATDVNVFQKDPRGVWFGDPAAARTLSVCADLEGSPGYIHERRTEGSNAGAVRHSARLAVLGTQGSAARKAVLEGCFWEPSDRAEYNRLRGRISKNVTRLADCGRVDTESRPETVLKHTGKSLDTYPRRIDGSRMISETERILSYLEEETEVRRQRLLADVRTSHSARILKHLREEGVVERLHGGGDERSWVALTGDGETVMAELIEPLFRAIHPDFSFDYGSLGEYERIWRETPTVDAGYLDGPFRETLQMYREHNRRYKSDVKKVNQVDRQQNPWR